MSDAKREFEISGKLIAGEPIGDIPALLRKVEELTTSRDCWRTIAEGREKEIHAWIDDIERLKKELAEAKLPPLEWVQDIYKIGRLESELADLRILAQRDSRPSNHQCSDT